MADRFETQRGYEEVFSESLSHIQSEINENNKNIESLRKQNQSISDRLEEIGKLLERKNANFERGAFEEADLEFEKLVSEYKGLCEEEEDTLAEIERYEDTLKELNQKLQDRMAYVKNQWRSVLDGHRDVSQRLKAAKEERKVLEIKRWSSAGGVLSPADEARLQDLISEIIPALEKEERNYYRNKGFNITDGDASTSDAGATPEDEEKKNEEPVVADIDTSSTSTPDDATPEDEEKKNEEPVVADIDTSSTSTSDDATPEDEEKKDEPAINNPLPNGNVVVGDVVYVFDEEATMQNYRNSGYDKNVYGEYFNVNIDEYDPDYTPINDPLFRSYKEYRLINIVDEEATMQNYRNSGYGKNVYGEYFNVNTDEYDPNYSPLNDPLFQVFITYYVFIGIKNEKDIDGKKIGTIDDSKIIDRGQKKEDVVPSIPTEPIPTEPVPDGGKVVPTEPVPDDGKVVPTEPVPTDVVQKPLEEVSVTLYDHRGQVLYQFKVPKGTVLDKESMPAMFKRFKNSPIRDGEHKVLKEFEGWVLGNDGKDKDAILFDFEQPIDSDIELSERFKFDRKKALVAGASLLTTVGLSAAAIATITNPVTGAIVLGSATLGATGIGSYADYKIGNCKKRSYSDREIEEAVNEKNSNVAKKIKKASMKLHNWFRENKNIEYIRAAMAGAGIGFGLGTIHELLHIKKDEIVPTDVPSDPVPTNPVPTDPTPVTPETEQVEVFAGIKDGQPVYDYAGAPKESLLGEYWGNDGTMHWFDDTGKEIFEGVTPISEITPPIRAWEVLWSTGEKVPMGTIFDFETKMVEVAKDAASVGITR